jgi:cell surface protein SprA
MRNHCQWSSIERHQMVGFIRFGNDFTQNFYQIEIPLKVTNLPQPQLQIVPCECWFGLARRNEFIVGIIDQVKILAMSINRIHFRLMEFIIQIMIWLIRMVTEVIACGYKRKSNFGLVRTLMVGVKTMKLETISKVRFGSMNCVWLIWTIKVVWLHY